MQRNSYLGEKRRFCECVTMVSGLSVFTAFTLYIIFAYGFTIFGTQHPFNVVKPSEPNSRIGVEGTEVKYFTCEHIMYVHNGVTYRIVLTIFEFIPICRMEPLNLYAKPIHLGSGVNGYIWTSNFLPMVIGCVLRTAGVLSPSVTPLSIRQFLR